MHKLLRTTAFFLFASLSVQAQNSGLDLTEYINPDSLRSSYDKLALALSADKDLQEQKGWKYIARWIDFANRHTTGNGQTPSAGLFAREVEQYANLKHKTPRTSHSALRTNPWSPAGPFNAPESINDLMFTGTGRINTIAFHPTDPNIMWAGAGQGGIWKTTNRAASWFPLGDDLPVMRISDIAVNPNDPDEIYICVGDYAYLAYWLETSDVKRNTHFGMGVYKTNDGGSTWEPTGLTTTQFDEDASLFRRTFIDDADDNTLLAAGIKGIFRSSDRGESWEQVFSGEIWDIERDPSDPGTLYASTGYIGNLGIGEAAMWKSIDFGVTWQKLDMPIPAQDSAQRLEIAVSPADPNYVYVVACDMSGGLFGFYRSTDRGESWEQRANSPNILHWYEGGSTGGQGTYDLAILADKANRDVVYVGGVNQWVTQDGGATWTGVSHWTGFFGPGVHADHHYLAYSPHDTEIYLCHDGGVSRTKEIVPGSWDDAFSIAGYEWPTVWEHLNEGLANLAFYRLGVSQLSENIYAGAQDMGTFLRDEGDWSYNSLGDGMECIISPLSDDILYGSSQYGNIFKSEDRGQTFAPFAFDPPWQGEFAEWTTPFAMHPANPFRLYIPAENVYVTDDAGFTFEKRSDFSSYPISAFAAAPGDAERMYVGKRVWYGNGQPGEVYVGDNDQWTNITAGTPADSLYITFLEVDDEDPDIAWATFAGFAEGAKVYETRNAGQSWENISLNLPNLPANCIIQHDGADHNPLYVGMDRGIWYKNDTMDQWILYSEGLPNVIVQDFDIHYADGLLYTATFGRGIWVNNLLDNAVSGASDVMFNAEISITPNPASGPVELRALSLPDGDYRIELINTTGQVMHSQLINTFDGFVRATIDPPGLSGLYYVRIIGRNGMRSLKVFWN